MMYVSMPESIVYDFPSIRAGLSASDAIGAFSRIKIRWIIGSEAEVRLFSFFVSGGGVPLFTVRYI